MTESTMLRQAAIGKLLDIQELCNKAVELDESDVGCLSHGDCLADKILNIIKAT